MLQSLTIHHFALIDDLTVQFFNGLHVLTGETGAGKSIVVDALAVVLGGRVEKEMIRTGSHKAYIEALFTVDNLPAVFELLTEYEIEAEESCLTISREILENGRSIARICGVSVPIGYIRKISTLLFDIHGQHEHQSLLDVKKHLLLLDSYGGTEHAKLISDISMLYSDFIKVHTWYVNIAKESKEQGKKKEWVSYQLQELIAAEIKKDEDILLAEEKQKLQHIKIISDGLQTAYDILTASESSKESVISSLYSVTTTLSTVCALDGTYSEVLDNMNTVIDLLTHIGNQLERFLNSISFDSARYDIIDERIDLLKRLSAKYKVTLSQLIPYQHTLEKELTEISTNERSMEDLKEKHKILLKAYRTVAHSLTASRKSLALMFENQMIKELADLGMANAVFYVVFDTVDSNKPIMPSINGDDQIAFSFSANSGEPPKPLAKIASGGEISRIMLAIKALNIKHGDVPSMVFDEIDAGISGKTAQVIAEKMNRIAHDRQVICVTHLPQIAAMADHHYLVEKLNTHERSVTSVRLLSDDQRVYDISRLISGVNQDSRSALLHAKDMLTAAAKSKS